jgi:hypothetical protein
MAEDFRTPEHEAQYRQYLEYFDRSAHVDVEGTRYAWSEEDLRELALSARYYMFIAGDLNSAVYANAVRMARSKLRPRLTRAQILALCAGTLRTTVEDVERSLQWTANYMAFHDGTDPETEHPYPPSET